eukprot:gene8838-786_t
MKRTFDVSIETNRLLLSTPSKIETENEYCDNRMKMILSHTKTMNNLKILLKEWKMEEIKERRLLFTKYNINETAFYLNLFKEKETENSFIQKGVLIGSTGFREIHINENDKEKWAEFGIVIYEPYWKLGIALEAHYHCLEYVFNQFDLDYVIFSTTKENIPMLSFYKKFKIEFFETRSNSNIDWQVFKLTKKVWKETVQNEMIKSMKKN